MSLRPTKSRTIKKEQQQPLVEIHEEHEEKYEDRQREELNPTPTPTPTPPPPTTRTTTTTTATAPSSSSSSLAQQALASTANLANLLPTGTLLAFQILTPIFSGNGVCDTVTRPLTQLLLFVLASTAFLASFTDSFRLLDGKVYYGLATRKGMWLFDSAVPERELPDLTKYRLRRVDFIHAFMSVLVFIAISLRDKNVFHCFYPRPRQEDQEFINIVPLGIGFFCSMMFVVFPTRRHGIGYPVSNDNN